MSIMLKTAKREHGEKQPHIKLGIFEFRIPFVHIPLEFPEIIQSAIVIVVGISATTYLEELFGIPFEIALGMVVAAELLKVIQNMFGDAMVQGWITPAIPIVLAYLLSFEDITSRMHALIWLQLILGLLFIVLGVTGLATKLVEFVPNTVKSGILIGSAFAALIGLSGFGEGGTFDQSPVTFSIGVLLSLFLLYSSGFKKISKRFKDKGIFGILSKAGFVPAVLLAFLVGILAGEVNLPQFNFSDGFFFNPIPGLLYSIREFSLIGLGFPDMSIILSAIPIAFMIYIISFGNVVAGIEFIKDADNARDDESVTANPDVTNIITGLRNLFQGLFAPSVVLSGPLWAAMMVTITERYKTGKDNMYSLWGGVTTFNASKVVFFFLIPVVQLVQPILPIAMSLTMMIQAFASFTIALGMLGNNTQRGVAGMIGGIMAITQPHIGLIIGLVISFVIEYLFDDTSDIENESTVNNEEILKEQ